MPSNGGKIKKIRFWTLKIFFITFLLAGAISLLAEYLTGNISLFFAVLVLLFIILVGVTFDMIGMAFAVCDKTPFVAMASKKIKKAREALMLLKNAAAVANFCGDVIGDICGIVSGATGAAIAVKILVNNPTFPEIILSMLLSAGVAASTVALKSIGKNIAIRKNREIVGAISAFLSVFMPERKN